MNNVLYTIGSSNRSEEEFIGILKRYGITLLIDVRSKRGSRVLHFDETRFGNLSLMLKRHGIDYDGKLHKSLGGFQYGKMTLGNFRRYTLTSLFAQALEQLKSRVQEASGHAVILCCEREPRVCHRKIIGEIMKADGWQVVSLK